MGTEFPAGQTPRDLSGIKFRPKLFGGRWKLTTSCRQFEQSGGKPMRNRTIMLALFVMTAAGFVAGLLVASRIQRVQAQATSSAAFPAVPGQKGGEDITGPYDVVAD